MKRALLWLIGLGTLFLPLVPPPPLASGAYVQRVVGDRAVIAMITPEADSLTVEVWDPAGGPGAAAGPDGFRRWHALEVDGLLPERRYHYRVRGHDGHELDRGSFRTPPERDEAPVRFGVIGDSGGQPPWVWLEDTPILALPARWDWLPLRGTLAGVGERLAQDPPDFWVHVGDVVYPSGEQRHFDTGFFQPFADLLRHSPVYAVLGNHDLYDGGEGRPLLRNLHLPTNPVTGDERLFSFAHGSVRIIGLDLNRLRDEDGNVLAVGPDHPAIEFLQRELPRVTEPWVVVMSHYPYRSASRHRDRDDLLACLEPLLVEYGVDLYLSGHDHTYQRFGDPDREPVAVVSGGGGKSLYALREHPDVRVASSTYHHCIVEAAGRVLWLRAVAADGILDEVRLELGRDPATLRRLAELAPGRYARIRALL